METVYFTVVAVVLYLVANWVLERIEIARGGRFEHRTLLFFVILLLLAVTSFALIRRYTGNP